MSNYKLTYFNIRGRAELIRLIFAAAGVQYDDVRIEFNEWSTLKPKTPFGQMPLLDIGDIHLHQSKAIARYLARKFNLAGKTDLDQTRADIIIDCIDDTTKPIFHPGFMFATDETKKAETKKKYLEEQLPVSLSALEKILKENKGGDGYFVGDELSWADLGLVDLAGFLNIVGGDVQIANYPKLHALRQRLEKLPKVAEWLAKRPESFM